MSTVAALWSQLRRQLAGKAVARYLAGMPASASAEKSRRFRERQKARGLKLVRIWTFDPEAPGFRERLAADAERINRATNSDDQAWMDTVAADMEAMIEAEERGRKS